MCDQTTDALALRSNARRFAAAIGIAVFALVCGACGQAKPEDPGTGAPTADFTQDATEGGPGLTVQFSDASAGSVTSYAWDFGTAGTSSEQNPRIQFDTEGTYSVRLTASGAEGVSVLEKPMLIAVLAPEEATVAAFEANQTAGGAGLTVEFTNTSVGELTSYEWEFGAAGTSSEMHPTVVFTEVGQYTVKLTVTGSAGQGVVEKESYITVHAAEEAGVAGFTADKTAGGAGMVVQFVDTSLGEPLTHDWEFFGAGGMDETSNEKNPTMAFPAVGLYSVKLTVTGAGGLSTLTKTDFIEVHDAPTAGFTCTPAATAFAPVTRTCQDDSVDATSWLWDFGDGSSCFYTTDSELSAPAGVSLCTSRHPVHTYENAGEYVIEQVATGPGGSDTHSIATAAEVMEISASTGAGPAPLPVLFTANTNGVDTDLYIWTVDGAPACLGMNGQPSVSYCYRTFKHPGTYTVAVYAEGVLGSIVPASTVSLEFTVEHAPPTADFTSAGATGTGPLEVEFSDESTGALDSWLWDFGDGTSCFYTADPELSPPPGALECDSSSPSHEYTETGAYDVTLTVTGPEFESEPGTITSTATKEHEVHVSIMDASFELQTANSEIGGAWTHLRPTNPTELALHRALSEADGDDIGMPSDGQKWASLDGLGTDGSAAVEALNNGIQQDFLYPSGSPVLEFDYTFLYAEPPAAQNFDEIVATVSDGTTTLVIPSSVADTSTAYAGQSARFPTRDSSIVRSTPRHTASINLADTFPGSDSLTRFTLTIRTGNANNDLRSPRAFVDHVRFSEPEDALPVEFSLDESVVFTNEEAHFVDETCAQPEDACDPPTSWRWDFDTHESSTAPAASGSGDQDPAYTFSEAGEYDVELIARRSDAEGVASMSVTVIDRPVASFEMVTPGPHSAPVSIEFRDTSTLDPLDLIETWSWDFAGWGDSSAQNPAPVDFLQSGEYIVRLTVTTESGVETSAQLTVVVE